MKVKFKKRGVDQPTFVWENLTDGLWKPVREERCIILVTQDNECRVYIDEEGIVEEACGWEGQEFVKFCDSIILEN